ncbi:hypothetical protein N8D56_14525 [Devosia sp. A8/3-2]|nr:hypothetical protein N8D56_14525 [Devosia sp. A8/3-2]
MNKILATLIALTIAVTPQAATAFDQLERFAPLFTDDPQNPLVFTYVAPLGGFTQDNPALYGTDDYVLLNALIDSTGVEPSTGIDFPQVVGMLSTGQPPRQLTVLFGKPGFLDATEAALTKRGFTRSEVASLTVMSKGEDYALDLATADDLLGSGMGKAQRPALGEDFLLRTAGWPELRTALTNLENPGATTALWRATIAGLRRASGSSWLDTAIGWNAVGFLDVGDPARVLLNPDSAKTKQPATAALPVFPHAIIALTQDRDGGAIRIALPFGTAEQAQQAGVIVADRLLAQPNTADTQPSIAVETVASFFVAVVTIEVEGETLADTAKRFAGQNNAVMQRGYEVLKLGL